MIDYQLVRFPIVGPLDTKVDPAVVERPTLVQALNCWMDRTASLSKRFGYVDLGANLDVAGASVPAFVGLTPFEGTFIGHSHDYAYMYLPTSARYTPLGSAVSAVLSVTDLSALSATNVRYADHASVGNYTLYATWEDGNVVRWILRDDSTDSLVSSEDISTAAYPRVVARGNVIYLFYASTAATQLRVRLFDLTSTTTLVASLSASPVTVATDYDTSSPIDAVSNPTYGIFVAYGSTTANTIKWGFVSAAGALSSTSTAASVATPTCISCAVAGNASAHGIVYARQTTPNDVYAILLSFNGVSWSTTSTSGAIDSSMTGGCSGTACAWESNNTTLTLWYVDEPVGLRLHQGSYTTGGVATGRAFTVYRARLAAKPFRYNGTWYAPVTVDSGGETLQSCIYVVSVDGVALSGRPISGTPVAVVSENAVTYAASRANLFGQTTSRDSSTQFRFAFTPRLTPGDVATSLAALRRTVAASATLDFQSPVAHKAVQIGDLVFFGGAVLTYFDGGPNGIVESGFLRLVDPEQISVTKGGGGSLTASSSYSYQVVPEYLDAHGVREQGTNFGPKVVSLGPGEDEVTLAIPTIATSSKGNLISFGVYRTLSNGETYYRVGSVANDPTAVTVSFNDTLADGDIDTNEVFPYADGALLDNTPPPGGHVIGAAAGRLFVASPTTRGLIYASKLRSQGEPLEFNDALTIQLPEDTGEVTALAQMSGVLVAFTERAIYRVPGLGPDNTGEGSFLTPERLGVDTGCANQHSVVETPIGIMFRGAKGFCLLDQSWQPQYIGAPLENPQGTFPPNEDVYGLLVPERQQVRYSDGSRVWVFDYFHRQWFEWQFPWTWGNGSSALMSGLQYAAADGLIYRETQDAYSDDGDNITMTVKLAPFKEVGGLNGQMRVRRAGLAGQALGAFTLTVTTARDFGTSTHQTLTKAVSGAGPFAWNERVTIGVLAGLQLTVSDAGPANGGMRLQEIAVEIGARGQGKSFRRA